VRPILTLETLIRLKAGDACRYVAVAKSIRISGAHCLGPVELKKAIADVPVGGLLEVVTNDVCAKEDIPTWCRFTKNELVEFQELGDGWMRFVIRRTR
jgi:TusA-related sulfurtransferase